MKVHRGKVHKFLGMTLDFTEKSKVQVSIINNIKEIITAWDDTMADLTADGFNIVTRKKKVTSAAPDDLFIVDENSPCLPQKQATVFHNIVAKILYNTKQARPDTSLPILMHRSEFIPTLEGIQVLG